MCHDMRMAERNRGAGLDQGKVRLKKHLHRLRPFLACMRIDQGMGAPPIEFGALLDRFRPSGPIREVVDALVWKNKRGDELDLAPEIPFISDGIRPLVGAFAETTKETPFAMD